MSIRVRLVTFDVLHTLITPRLPIFVQYSLAFRPFLGSLDPNAIKTSFKSALGALQRERPAYEKGSKDWWSEVIYRTALSADADPTALKASLPEIVDNLMERFSSKEGYRTFDDSIPTLQKLHSAGILTAVVSNSDSRTRSVLQSLEFPEFLNPILLSEEEGIEKPSSAIFTRALERINSQGRIEPPIQLNECLHIGDELPADYHGAISAGMQASLLNRPGDEETRDVPDGVHTITRLDELFTSAAVKF